MTAFLDKIFKKGKDGENEAKQEIKKPSDEAKTTLVPKSEQEQPKAIKPKSAPKKEKAKQFLGVKDFQIFIRPFVTEKAAFLRENNVYIFEVSQKANKIEIKKAFQNIFNLIPVDVRIINKRGKNVRYGKSTGKTKGFKKALITLKKGESIESLDLQA
jgi:large subunit ribosomal protein L23